MKKTFRRFCILPWKPSRRSPLTSFIRAENVSARFYPLPSKLFDPNSERLVKLACAFEFIHTATLLHDDVIDHATLRRGRPASNALWGNKASVLVGDYLYCKATSIIAQDGDFNVLGIIAEVTGNTTEGEVLEILKSNDPSLTQEAYLEIVQYKTACLMAAAAEVGAIAGRASAEDQRRLKSFGMRWAWPFNLPMMLSTTRLQTMKSVSE